MFHGDGEAYALAKSRITTLGQVATVACPIAGAWLAQKDLRLPWLIAAGIHLVQTLVAARMLQETLPQRERTPLRWNGVSPLSFLKLLAARKLPAETKQIRLLAFVTVWQSAFDSHSTHQYTELHQTQMLGWGLEQRGRFASFRGFFSIFSSALSGPIVRAIGVPNSLQVGFASAGIDQLFTALSTSTWHFYATRPIGVLRAVSDSSMAYTASTVGRAAGFSEGELQGALVSSSS